MKNIDIKNIKDLLIDYGTEYGLKLASITNLPRLMHFYFLNSD